MAEQIFSEYGMEEDRQELIRLRRDFHKHPEMGFAEFRTQEKIMDYLANIGIPAEKIAGTGVKAVLTGGKPGKTILLRSDMDALGIHEETGLPFQSVNDGVMHACGHDGHMAMLLKAAQWLAGCKEDLAGNIVFAFQPNEEDAGAWKMVEEGVLKSPNADAAFGCHLWSQLDTGIIDICAGPVMAASHYFNMEIKGRGGHAGFAHESVDPIHTAAQVIQGVQAIQTRQINALDPAVIMFTKIAGGTNETTVPETVTLAGSVRFLYHGGQEVLEKFEQTAKDICRVHGAQCRVTFKVGNHMLANDPAMTGLVRQISAGILGSQDRVTSTLKTMAGEDFSEFSSRVPSAFAFVGAAKKAGSFPHHHPQFDIDEAALITGARLYVDVARAYLA